MCFPRVRIFCSKSLHILSHFSAGDAIRTCSFAHLIAVVLCQTHKLLPPAPMTLAGHIQWPALRLIDSFSCSSNIFCISKNVVTTQRSGPSNQALSDLWCSLPPQSLPSDMRLHCSCFLNGPSGSKSGGSKLPSRTWPRTRGDDPNTPVSRQISIVVSKIAFSHQ